MATWIASIVATQGRADFWAVAGSYGIVASTAKVSDHVLIDCADGFPSRSITVARELSAALSTTALGFVAQTAADVYQLHAFAAGRCVRQLDYSRDEGGWLANEGSPQPWERDFFFDSVEPADEHDWPSGLNDELGDEDVARYFDAKRLGDPSPIIHLVHPSSTSPLVRVCESFGITADEPAGRWQKQSFWRRLFGKTANAS